MASILRSFASAFAKSGMLGANGKDNSHPK